MPITFTKEDFSRHIKTRGENEAEEALEPMPSASEVASWEPNRHIPNQTPIFNPNYNDGVSERRDAEKARRDRDARARLAADPVMASEELKAAHVRGERATNSTLRLVGNILGKSPHLLNWSCHMAAMSGMRVVALARRCARAPDPVFAWNLNVSLNKPKVAASPRRYDQSAYIESGTRMKGGSVSTYTPKKNNKDMVDAWMRAAEMDILPNRSTTCAATGKSLISKTNGWRISPSFNGIAADTAQQIAVAAAIKAGLTRGMIKGTPPPMVQKLIDDPMEWLSLVIATQHPLFYSLAIKLSKTLVPEPAREPSVIWKDFANIARQQHDHI